MTADRRLDRRVLQNTAAVIGVTWTDQDDNATAAPSTPNVVVTNHAGTVLQASTPATPVAGSAGRYTVILPLSATAVLDQLAATWTASGQSRTTVHDVCGGWYFSASEAALASQKDDTAFDLNQLLVARIEVEDECEWICGVAFVPRFAYATFVGDGSRELQLPFRMVRTIRSVTVTPWAGAARTWTATQLEQTRFGYEPRSGKIVSPSGDTWTDQASVVVAYEHGWDRPDPMIVKAAIRRLRTALFESDPTVWDSSDDDARTAVDLETNAGPFRTGDPQVDAVYSRYSMRQRGRNSVAASRPLVFDNQRTSMFHRTPR